MHPEKFIRCTFAVGSVGPCLQFPVVIVILPHNVRKSVGVYELCICV